MKKDFQFSTIQLFTAYTTLSGQLANEQLRDNSHINKHGKTTQNENPSLKGIQYGEDNK